jgi:Family of unknown function (DUF6232)
MTLYYRGPAARITDKALEVWRPTRYSYAIHELNEVSIVESRGPVPGTRVVFASCGLAAFAALVAVVGWPVFGDAPISVVALVAMIGAAAVAGCVRRPHAARYELWAIYRGQEICLFRTTDAQTFGQVRRALQRAVEANTW